MEERRILVFDGAGLISNVDKLSWKIKAIVAQEEREKIARRVRDNLRFLKRDGYLLGVVPQGYMRVDGQIVQDPEAGPIIRELFRLYATGNSVRSLAEYLNDHGIRPHRGPNKAKHNRPAAVIFTSDVVKDILTNPSYRGKVMVDGELIEGKHPALVDEATWQVCADVRARNQRRTSKTWTRHSYPSRRCCTADSAAVGCMARLPRREAGWTCITPATTPAGTDPPSIHRLRAALRSS